MFTAPKFDSDKKLESSNLFSAKPGLSFADLAQVAKPQGFGGGFGGGFGSGQQTTLFGAKPMFGSSTKTEEKKKEGEEDDENQNPEEYVPEGDFKPIVKLHEVEVKTGEEDEEVLFKQRCKLFRFHKDTKEWKEKGVGEMKILKHKTKENNYRVLMRRDQVLKLCANHRISPEIKLEVPNEKQLRWLANDFSEEDAGNYEYLTAKFRHEEEAKSFREIFEKAQKIVAESKPSAVTPVAQNNTQGQSKLASMIKKETGTWNCTACYAPNKVNAEKCACCSTPNANKNDNNKGRHFCI